MLCAHTPPCPPIDALDHDAARVIAHHEQNGGYSLLCNGAIVFNDGGEILTVEDRVVLVAAQRGPARHALAA